MPARHRSTAAVVVSALALLLGGCGGSATSARSTSKPGAPAGHATTTTATTAPVAPGGPVDIYSHDMAGDLAPQLLNVPPRVYVPESAGRGIDVIDPSTMKVIDRYDTGLDPQHIVPSWDLSTLYVTNDLGNSLTPIDPMTGKPKGPNIKLPDPYNLYFTTDGRYAIVVEEARRILAFRDAHTFALVKDVPVACRGVDHADFSADGRSAFFSCEFSGQMVKVDIPSMTVDGYLDIAGSSMQDVKLDSAGTTLYSADMKRGGVYLIDPKSFTVKGFIPTGRDAHGLYISRNTKDLYVTNRGSGTVSVIDLASQKVVQTWTIPGGGSPDMGNVSADGTVLWVSGRYNACVYAISTVDGHLIAKIPVPNEPHGLAVWPQPGRYSLGHTGIMR
ncbi:MAG TPA: hypothetical protein VFP61_16175 [Acidimicrobiales bacterium]|nr:hypothetical protein [Acidimicrobiales bacterium]